MVMFIFYSLYKTHLIMANMYSDDVYLLFFI